MSTLNLWIARHRRRLALGVFLQKAGEGLAVFLFLFGACVLVTKLFRPEWWPHVLWLLGLLIPIFAWAAYRARQTPFSETEAIALLDRQFGGGGLIMALAEIDDPHWENKLPETPTLWKRKLPKIRPTRFLRTVGWPAAFTLGALLIPLRGSQATVPYTPHVGQQATSQLETMVGLLEDSGVMPPEETQAIKTVLEQLSKETEAGPLTNEKWETIDHLRTQLTQRLTEDETEVGNATDLVTRLITSEPEKAVELITSNPQALEQVGKLLGNLQQSGVMESLPGLGSPEIQRLLQEGQRQLVENPKFRGQVFGQVQSLLKSRSNNLQSVRQRFDQAFQQLPRFSNLIGGNSAKTGVEESVETQTNGRMKWGEESQARQNKFQQVVLPPGMAKTLAQETPERTIPRIENVNPSQNVAATVPTEFSGTSAKEVRTRELRPRHRAVVQQYFQNDDEAGSKE